MTRTTNARVAGFTFLFYIAVGLAAPFLGERVGPRRLAGAALVVAGVAVLAGA